MQVVAKQLGAIFRVGCGGGASTTAASAAIVNTTSRRGLAAAPAKAGASMKLGGGLSKKGSAQIKKVVVAVETDPEKLVKFCCGLNIYKTGGEEVPIKPDAEYPEWLWELTLDRGPTLDEMQPDTLEWWSRKRRIALRYKNKLSRNKYPEPFIPKSITSMKLA